MAILLALIVMTACGRGLAGGNECTQKQTVGPKDVNMCENGTHTVTTAYISASSSQLGDGTRCTCTIVALSPASNGSYIGLNQVPRVSNCSAVITVQGSSQVQFTCLSPSVNTNTHMNTSNVIIEVLRNGSDDFGFCVLMFHADNKQENEYNLTCETDASETEATTSATTEASTLTSTLLSNATSASSTPSSLEAMSTDSSTTSFPASTIFGTATSTPSSALGSTLASAKSSSDVTVFSTSPTNPFTTSTILDLTISTSTTPLTSTSTLSTSSAGVTASTSSSTNLFPASMTFDSATSTSALDSTSVSTLFTSPSDMIASTDTTPQAYAPSTAFFHPSSSDGTDVTFMETSAVSLSSATGAVTEVEETTSTDKSGDPSNDFPVIHVAAGVAGGILFLVILIIVIVVLCVRRKRKTKENALRGNPEINRSYLRFSEVVLEDNILYESSSAFPAGDTPKTGSATQPVEDKTGGSPTSGKTSVQPGRGQYLGPAGDLYSLVQKPREDGGPEDASSAQRHSTAVDAPPADEEEDEEDTASQHDVAANDSLPAECDLAFGSLWSSSPTPEMHFNDVELALGHGGQTVQGPSDGGSPTTDYTVIDHEATRDVITDL